MTKASKPGNPAIVGDGKNGSSTRIAVAGLAILMTLLVGTARNLTARRDPETRSADLKVSVRVYNYARSSADMVRLAENETERIFARAGVHLEWHECVIMSRAESADSICTEPMTPSDLRLRIFSRLKLMPTDDSAESIGFTVANLATVQLEPLQDLMIPTHCILPVMLGRTIAHEIGHALLGAGHSSKGIMRARWDAGQLEFAASNEMVFTSDQERALRLTVKTRNGQ